MKPGDPDPSGDCQPFTGFIGIDWSGASGAGYRGIAVASCGADGGAPHLVSPNLCKPGRAGHWSRQQVHDWLLSLLEPGSARSNRRWLVGIDCAFSLPWAGTTGWFDDGDRADVYDLWDLIETASAGSGDFLGSPFALDPRYCGRFRHTGIPNPDHTDLHRRAELACAAQGLGQPQSPYRLVGAKQVGKAGLAGMRMLRSLKERAGSRIAIWPFERAGMGKADLVLAEIYPRLFLRRAGFGNHKIRDGGALDRALRALGAPDIGQTGPVSDHDSDALVSAAGLRLISADPQTWRVALTGSDVRREGWIIGVTEGTVAD